MVQEFRPADVIEEDALLAEQLIEGDVDALMSLVDRYGHAVHAVVATSDGPDRSGRSVDVFVQAWAERESVGRGGDFGPWIGGLAATSVGRSSADVDTTWAIARAVDAIGDVDRASLHAHHVHGEELADGAERSERLLRRRLAHLGDDSVISDALRDPANWDEAPSDLAQRVRSRLDPGARLDDEVDDVGGGAALVDDGADGPGLLARSLRPVLLGLGGAVAVLFIAIIALSAASGSPDPVAFTADLTPTGAILDVDGGELTATERDSVLQLDLEAPTLPRRAGDQYYEGLLMLTDGAAVSVGTFNEGIDVTLSGGVALDRVDEFLVVARQLGTDDFDVVLKLDVPRS